MAFTKGAPRPAGAGRKKGSRNHVTLEREKAIAATGITPLEYMLSVLRDSKQQSARRDWAAQAAAPYVHPKLASATVDTTLAGELVIRWQPSSPAKPE